MFKHAGFSLFTACILGNLPVINMDQSEEFQEPRGVVGMTWGLTPYILQVGFDSTI